MEEKVSKFGHHNIIVSVTRKEKLEVLIDVLGDSQYKVWGSLGSVRHLLKIGVPSQDLFTYTKFNQILDGRVKTLHPKIYGGILYKRGIPHHEEELIANQITPIDIVICNLYSFEDAVKKGLSMEETLDLIDIGGVSLIRAAAKNWEHVIVLTDPNDYQEFADNYQNLMKDKNYRLKLALKAFKLTSNYDDMIQKYLATFLEKEEKKEVKDSKLVEITQEAVFEPNEIIPMKYGCNPHQTTAYLQVPAGIKNPLTLLNGQSGYINMLDALGSWQLVRELKNTLGLTAVASFKHTSPAGVAVNLNSLESDFFYSIPENLQELVSKSSLAQTFLKARYADPKSSFGDFIALSDPCDYVTAKLIAREVSDGIIAPDFSPEALDVLRKKKNGKYLILKIDPEYHPAEWQQLEKREIFGLELVQNRNETNLNPNIFQNKELIPTANKNIPNNNQVDLILSHITLKYAQSNNVVFAKNGQVIGVAAGQQSRVDCVKLAGQKAFTWYLRQHPKVMEIWKLFRSDINIKRQDKINAVIQFIEGDFTPQSFSAWSNLFSDKKIPDSLTFEEKQEFLKTIKGVSLASDAFFPNRDNIDHASRFGVEYIIQPGGSIADQNVIQACDEYKIVMIMNDQRQFTH